MLSVGFDQPGMAQQARIALRREGRVCLPPVAVRGETCRESVVLEDGRDLLIIGNSNGDVHITSDGWEWSHLQNDQPIKSVSGSAAGRILVGMQSCSNVWDVRDKGEFVSSHDVTNAELSACGCLMAHDCTTMASHDVAISDVGSGRRLDGLSLSLLHPIRPKVWSPNCQFMTIGWLGCNVALWRLGSPKPMWQTKLGKVGPRVHLEIRRFDWSPNGQLIACLMGGWDMPGIFVVTTGGELLEELQAPPFSRDIFFVDNGIVATIDESGKPVFYRLP